MTAARLSDATGCPEWR